MALVKAVDSGDTDLGEEIKLIHWPFFLKILSSLSCFAPSAQKTSTGRLFPAH